MVHHQLYNPSVQYSINDVTAAAPVPDINNNEDNFEDRMGNNNIEGRGRGKNRKKGSFEKGEDCQEEINGNENETGSGIPLSFDEEMSIQEPLYSSLSQVQIIPSSIPPSPSILSSKEQLFTPATDYANDNHKCCSSNLDPASSSSTPLLRSNELSDNSTSSERQVQNQSVNETDPEMVIEFEAIRDDIELIVDIYLFIEKSSWALKSMLW